MASRHVRTQGIASQCKHCRLTTPPFPVLLRGMLVSCCTLDGCKDHGVLRNTRAKCPGALTGTLQGTIRRRYQSILYDRA